MTDTQFFMVRLLDHAGYYETRFLLALLVVGFAVFVWRKGDPRFAVAFGFGVVFQALLEWTLQANGLRGAYSLSLFGFEVAGPASNLLQGVLEGGPLSLFGYWFVRTADRRTRAVGGPALYGLGLVAVVVLATIAGLLAMDAPVSSARPIRFLDPMLIGTIVVAIAIAAIRGRAGLRLLGLFFLGVLIYAIGTFEPLHLTGVRYIGEGSASDYRPASWLMQIAIMAASLAIEVSASKLHYFSVPLALGLFDDRARSRSAAVIFLHGWLMRPGIWDAARRALPDKMPMSSLWQPCHGKEPCLPSDSSIGDLASRTWDRIDADHDGRVVLVGHSMGALVALQATLDRPDRVAGLVLTGATSRAWSEATVAGWRAMAGAAMHGWGPETASQLGPWLFGSESAKEPEFVRQWAEEVAGYNLAGMQGLVDAIATRQATDTRLREISVPVLVVHGALDASVPLEEAQFIAEALPKGELVVLPGAGHCPPVEAPEEFAEQVRRFVDAIRCKP